MRASALKSGTFRLKLAAARIFGLVKVERDQVSLSNIGKRVIDPENAQQARVQAFLSVPLYRAIFDKYKGYTLPRDAALEAEMQALGVSSKQTDKARQVFQRSAEQAHMLSPTRDRLVLPPNAAADQPGPGVRDQSSRDTPPAPVGRNGGSDHAAAKDHYLIKTLLRSLPPIGDSWLEEEQEDWLRSMRMAFQSLYNKA